MSDYKKNLARYDIFDYLKKTILIYTILILNSFRQKIVLFIFLYIRIGPQSKY